MRSHEISPASAGARPGDQKAAPSRHVELTHRIAASCKGKEIQGLAATLAASVSGPACYEASVRWTPHSGLRTGRMMIERAQEDVVEAIAGALGVTLPPTTAQWLDLAHRNDVPLIAGWDLRGGGQERCVKLYVNASDASETVRKRLCAELLPGVSNNDDPPAVLGMNARADGVTETKLYVQSADTTKLASRLGSRATTLAAAAGKEGADAGAVLSFDVAGGSARLRAFFVALREPHENTVWQCVRALPGYDADEIESLLPFPPAPPRSIGISLSDDTWTAYFKPRDSGRAPEALEPVAIFRLDGAEVGVFVEPTEHAARAFRRTERHAVSIRVRSGNAEPLALESLVDWFTDQLRTAERDGSGITTHLADPPPPWRIGEMARDSDRMEERS